MLAEKNPVAIESKVKTVRFLCELCKFKVCPAGVILDTFKTLCDNFSQHDAELTANILQCCGRFLMYTPETTTRTENLLERMMRLKNVKSLGLRLEIMLEDAYYTVKPPEGKRLKMKEKEPLEVFIENLVFTRMYTEEDEDKVLKFCRKLPWSPPSKAPDWLKKSILELNLHANYESIYLIASLLSGLAKYRDTFVIDVIDALMESIQSTCERNDFREMPLRVRQAKLIGELYNYRLVDSNLVFDTMYHYIGFGGPTTARAGHVTTVHKVLERCLALRKGSLGAIAEEGEDDGGTIPAILADPQHPLEPPWDFFRMKLVCVILDTCGHYFDRGAVKQKLDRFLQFFFRYVLSKGDLPLRVIFMVNDTLERIRPKMSIPSSKEAIDKTILKLLQTERETLDLENDGEDGEDEGAGEESSEDDESSSGSSGSDSEDSESEESGSSSEDSDSDSGDESKGKGKGKGGGKSKGDSSYSRGGQVEARKEAEVDEFEKEVEKLMLESFEGAKRMPRPQVSELPAPPTAEKRPEAASGPKPGMFSLMARPRGGKATLKEIAIPEDNKLVRVAQANVGAIDNSREDAEMKRKTMQMLLTSAPATHENTLHRFAPAQRAGKGTSKGGGSSVGRKNQDYVKGMDLPEEEDQRPVVEEQPRMRIVQARPRDGPKGKGKTGPATGPGSYSGASGGAHPAPGGSSGGKGRRPDQRGTPSNPGARGAF